MGMDDARQDLETRFNIWFNEEVLDVLDKLRENGRIIGIITHLEDMKTQIPLRLEVYRTDEGPSRVRMAVGGMN
jgi:hypothetical protein